MAWRCLSILGVGLLGGSIGLAVRKVYPDCHVVGYGHRLSSLQKAIERGAIHQATDNPQKAVQGADLVILGVPVATMRPLFEQIAPALAVGTIVTDVGSTKASIVTDAQAILPSGAHFVGSHPMAGSEKRGVEYARADLFQGALCITTPVEQTDPTALMRVESFWQALGMRLARLSPKDHDRFIGDISHLPHAVAAALVSMQQDAALRLAGKGFGDTTRIAAGDPALWRDIFLDNRQNLADGIDRLTRELQFLKQRLEHGDARAVESWLDQARARRKSLEDSAESGE